MRCMVEAKTVPVTQAAIHLNSRDKVLRAESAALRGSLQSERTAGPEGIPEFPRGIRKVLGSEGILREVPALECAGQDELQLDFMKVFLAGFRVRNEEVRFHVVAFAFFEDLVRAVLVFILDIKDGIDEVLALQRPEAILPAETREHGAVVEGGLAFQVQLRGPPRGRAILKLDPKGMEVVAASLGAQGGEIL